MRSLDVTYLGRLESSFRQQGAQRVRQRLVVPVRALDVLDR